MNPTRCFAVVGFMGHAFLTHGVVVYALPARFPSPPEVPSHPSTPEDPPDTPVGSSRVAGGCSNWVTVRPPREGGGEGVVPHGHHGRSPVLPELYTYEAIARLSSRGPVNLTPQPIMGEIFCGARWEHWVQKSGKN